MAEQPKRIPWLMGIPLAVTERIQWHLLCCYLSGVDPHTLQPYKKEKVDG